MQIKENKTQLYRIYDEIFDNIGFLFKFNIRKLVIGCFYTNGCSVSSMQIWIQPRDNGEFKTLNSYLKNCDTLTIELRNKCEGLHDFCKSYGDDWNSMTFIAKENLEYEFNYEYESIKIMDKLFLLNWKGNFFYN